MRRWFIGARVVVAAVAAVSLPEGARTQTFDVKLPEVKQGYLELGLDNSVFWGVPRGRGLNRSAHDQSLDYGVSSWWRLSGVIKVENPVGVSRGVVIVEVDGVQQTENAIALIDDEKTHNVRIVMGEPVRTEESVPAQQAQA